MKAYLSLMRFILMILAFILGMISSIVLLVGSIYFLATGVTLDGLEKFGIVIDTSEVLDDDVNTPIRSLTIFDLINEMNEISVMAGTATLDYLSEEYGIILPQKGSSELFDAMRVLPLSRLFAEEGIKNVLTSISVGGILGYEKRIDDSDPINPTVYWYDPITGNNLTGIETLFADYTLYELIYEGINVSAIADAQPIGVFLGFEFVDGEWIKNGGAEKLTGIMSFVASKRLSEVGTTLNDATLGEVLGYTKVDGVWMKDGVPMTGALKAFADNTLGNIEEGVDEIQIGTVLGYDFDEEIGWHKRDENGEIVLMTGSMKAFASDSLSTLENSIDTKQIGAILGYDQDPVTLEWYKLDEHGDRVPMTGTLKAFASNSLSNIEVGIGEAQIGTILGYDEDENGNWFKKEGDETVYLTGTMKAFASDTLETLDTAIDDKEIGTILGYDKETDDNGNTKWFRYVDDGAGGLKKDYMTGALTAFADNKLSNMEEGVNTAEIGTILGYEKDPDGKWFKYKEGSDTEKEYLTGTMLAFADESLSTLEHNIDAKPIGLILGYEKAPEPDGRWFKYKDDGVTIEYMTGALVALADNNLSNIEDGINTAEIGTILGYEKDPDGKWFKYKEGSDTEKEYLSGTMLAFANDSLSTLEHTIDSKEIGLILGYTLDGEVWKDESGAPVTGVMKAFAGMKLGTIDTEINTVPVGDILGYNNVDGVWYTDPDNTVPATGVMKFLADRKLNNIEEGINTEPIGTFLGYENGVDGWKDKNGDPVTGIMKAIADKNFDNVGTSLESEPIGIFLGYDNDGGVWKDENGNPVTGVMKVLADKNFANVGDSLNSEPIGTFLGYKDVNSDPNIYQWENENGEMVTGIMHVMASENLSSVGNITDKLKLGDIIPSDQRTGFLSLLDPTTEFDNMSTEITRVFSETSIEDLVACGAIELTETEKANLASNPIKDMNLSDMLKYILNLPPIPSIP